MADGLLMFCMLPNTPVDDRSVGLYGWMKVQESLSSTMAAKEVINGFFAGGLGGGETVEVES
jgi:hypothetical protein